MPRNPSPVCPCVVFAMALSVGACFAPAEASRGLPCTDDAACGSLSCTYGVCGGPTRCEAGAGVGEYCFTFDSREFTVTAGIDALGIGTVDPGPLPDIVVGNSAAQTLALLRNEGSGEFAEAVTSAAMGFGAREMTVGPIDGAGWSDVVVTTDASVVAVPIVPGGDATGAFATPLVLAEGLVGVARPQIGQFVDDAGGLADVAVLVDDGFDVVPQRELSVFGDPVHTALQAAADLRTFGADASRVYVASRSGNAVVGHSRTATGAFAATTTIDVGPSPSRFALADLDGDQFGDVLTAGASGKLWLTTGRDASFADPRAPVEVYDLGWEPTTLAALNLDDDPEPEYLVSGLAPGGRRDVFLFDNDGEGRPIYGGSLGVDDASAVVLADLDLDGIPEIVVASQERGTIRIARRAVAPPSGSESSSTGGSGTPGSSGSDPTNAADPSFPDPTLPTDPTTPVDETGSVDPCNGTGLSIGPYCYAAIQPSLPLGGRALGVATARLDPDAPIALVVVTSGGAVWEHPGDLGGVFADAMAPSHFASGEPTGLAVGSMSLGAEFDEAVIAVTHDAGLSVFSPQNELMSGEQPIEGGAFAPLVDAMIFDDNTQSFSSAVAFASSQGALLATASVLQDGDALLEAPGTIHDLDALGFEDQIVLMAAAGATLDAYVPSTFSLDGVGPLVDSPAYYSAVLRGPSYIELVVAGESDFSRVLFDVEGTPSVELVDQGAVIADFEVGEFDGADGDDLVVMVDDGGAQGLRIYGTLADGELVLLTAFSVEHASAFAVYDFWMPSDLLIAYDDPQSGQYLVHLGTLVAG